ncbi:MAG TPA: hypothetical protein VGJ08_15895, partial [Rhizomicrobium sp.]
SGSRFWRPSWSGHGIAGVTVAGQKKCTFVAVQRETLAAAQASATECASGTYLISVISRFVPLAAGVFARNVALRTCIAEFAGLP